MNIPNKKMDMNQIIEFVKTNILWIGGGVIVVGAWLNSYFKKHKHWPWDNLKKRLPMTQPIIKPKTEVKQQVQDNPLENFSKKSQSKIVVNNNRISEDISTATKLMQKKDRDIDQKMNEDLERIKQEFQEVYNEKEKIREYGQQLHALFLKYEKREFELTEMVMSIEKMVGPKKEKVNNEFSPAL